MFTPGGPVDAWGIGLDGSKWDNNGTGTVNIPGTGSTSRRVEEGLRGGHPDATVTWASTPGHCSGLQICKTTHIQQGGPFILTNVTAESTTGSTLGNVCYTRNVDPDNN